MSRTSKMIMLAGSLAIGQTRLMADSDVLLKAEELRVQQSTGTISTQFGKVTMPGTGLTDSAMSIFPCVRTLESGMRLRVPSCPDEDQCCSLDEYKENSASCVSSCTCFFEEERTASRAVVDEEYPVMIRGVPIFKQFDAKTRSGFQPIGCGAIALAELAFYYGSWGWGRILDAYESSGQYDWEQLAYDSADWLDTWIRNNASPNKVKKVTPAIEYLFSSLGYSVNVDKETVTDDDSEMSTAFGRIKNSINGGRPVYIGFDVNSGPGGGIGGGGDDFGFIDHYGLIVGYDDTGSTPKIDINMGWGYASGEMCADSDCIDVVEGVATYDWEIGSGKVHLWFVKLDASEKTRRSGSIVEECPLPSPLSVYTPNSVEGSSGTSTNVGVTYHENTTPVLETLIAGSDCALLGGEQTHQETYTYTATWTTGFNCNSLYDVFDDVLSGDWDPETPDLDDDILDELDPLP